MAKFGAPAAAEDYARALAFQPAILSAAQAHDLEPALIAAIGSRETRWMHGYFLGDVDVFTKVPHGYGPMQLDDSRPRGDPAGWKRQPEAWRIALCDGYRAGKIGEAQMIAACVALLAQTLSQAQAILSWADESLQRRAAIAAYNCGLGNVRRAIEARPIPLDVDHYTTGQDYSRDVIDRALWFARNGFAPSP